MGLCKILWYNILYFILLRNRINFVSNNLKKNGGKLILKRICEKMRSKTPISAMEKKTTWYGFRCWLAMQCKSPLTVTPCRMTAAPHSNNKLSIRMLIDQQPTRRPHVYSARVIWKAKNGLQNSAQKHQKALKNFQNINSATILTSWVDGTALGFHSSAGPIPPEPATESADAAEQSYTPQPNCIWLLCAWQSNPDGGIYSFVA